jgi:tetraacyldisaccharide 4'-kinase
MSPSRPQNAWDAWLPVIQGRQRGLLASVQRASLWCVSWLYRVAIAVRNWNFSRGRGVHRVHTPVLSVGNLTTGGTGKTPFVQWLCRYLRSKERRVALLSRGYGDLGNGTNDEALELELSLPDVPHLQDPDRVRMAGIAIEELEADCLVLDDGFQHRRLARDLDIVLVDATCPFGFGHLLPRGLLREPVSSVRRADAVVLTRCDQVPAEQLTAIRAKLRSNYNGPEKKTSSELPILESFHHAVALVNSRGQRTDISELTNANVLAFAGIGNPSAFFQTLRGLGANLVDTKTFADHHPYSREDVQELRTWVQQQTQANQRSSSPTHKASTPDSTDRPISQDHHGLWRVVTTRKDLVNLDLVTLSNVELVALEIALGMSADAEHVLHRLIDETLDKHEKTSAASSQNFEATEVR